MLAACRLSIVLLATASHAIVLPSARASPAMLKPHNIAPRPSRTLGLRGGSVQATAAVSGFLTGAMAIPAATGIAAIAGSLAYIHQAYIFSLSYGLAMLGIGGAVLVTAPSSLVLTIHAGLVSAYGMRLFAFLLWRQKFQAGYDGAARLKALDKTPPLQRTPIIASTVRATTRCPPREA